MSYTEVANIWDAVTDTPEEAANMRARSELMMALDDLIRKKGWSQIEAAKHLGITQPRVSELVNGKIQLFSLDQLLTLLARAGYRVEMKVKKAHAQKAA